MTRAPASIRPPVHHHVATQATSRAAVNLIAHESGEPLTGPGGTFAVDDKLRDWLCLIENRLYISRSHVMTAQVRAFEGRLRRLSYEYQVHEVELSDIRNLYDRAQTSPRRPVATTSQMQSDAKSIFARAVSMRASDIHIIVSEQTGTLIKARVHNDLTKIGAETHEHGLQLCTAIYQAMADVSDSTFEPHGRQDARIGTRSKLPEGLDGIRIATSPTVDGMLMVLRLLYDDTGANDIVALGYSEVQTQALQMLTRRPSGITIFTGPTGSGKSTTLQRMLSRIIEENGDRIHVLTVEDPVEYPIPGANQVPVTNAKGEEERRSAFSAAIRAALRLDPDVMMIGEIRDSASAHLAMEGAMTGHQMWSTLHANNAFASFGRLIDLGVPKAVLCDSSIISGFASQRLLKVLCPNCRQPLKEAIARMDLAHKADAKRIVKHLGVVDGIYVKGPGCGACGNTGTKGRTVAAEILPTDEELLGHVLRDDFEGARRYWRSNGGMTMVEHATQKVKAGLADPFEAELVVGMLTGIAIQGEAGAA